MRVLLCGDAQAQRRALTAERARGSWVNPCAGLDLLSCPAASSCTFALNRDQCLGILTGSR